MSLSEELARQRRDLLTRERATQRQVVAIYGETFRRVRYELSDLLARIGEAQRTGASPQSVAALLAREQRLERFMAAAQQELARFVLAAEPLLTRLQADHAQAAIGNTYTLTDKALGTRPTGVGSEFRPPSATVVYRLAGNAGDGTPLAGVLREVAGAQLKQARDELLIGVARGKNPRDIGRAMARALGTTATRTTVIARQESLRAYRQVTTDTMAANSVQNGGVVTGWVWSSAADMRTCPMCIAMTGQFFPADQTLDSHINCRCSQCPQTQSWADLGFQGIPDTRPSIPTGEQIFSGFTPTQQRTVLGPGKYQAYTSGQITLKDLVARTRSERWGPGRRTRALKELAKV